MNAIRSVVLGVVLLGSCRLSHALTNTMIAVSGTNIILYWPSIGYETYLIQYRPTLDPSTPWCDLTNDYPANSDRFTTYTLNGIVSPPSTGGSAGGFAGGSAPSPDMARAGGGALVDIPMVVATNSTGPGVPLALYPPGADLSGFDIVDSITGESVSGAVYVVSASSPLRASPMGGGGGATPDDLTNDVVSPETGFFRVFHIPDWLVTFAGYQFDGPTFIPVDFSEPDAPTNCVENLIVLINGQPTDDALFTTDVIDGTTYSGMGIYFDRFPNGTNTIQLLTTVRQSDSLEGATPNMTFSNAVQSIVINNFAIYTNWNDTIYTNPFTIQARAATTNINWEIDIYDVNGDLVNYQTGHSANGAISWNWDLTDYDGNDRSDGDNDPFFYPYLSYTPAGGGDPGGPMPPIAAQFPSKGSWLFAYLDNDYDDGTTNEVGADTYYHRGLSEMQGGVIEWGFGDWTFPISFGTNYSQATRNASWAELENTYLQFFPIRNFYYFGHGSPNSIGGDENATSNGVAISSKILPGSTAHLTSQWVHDNVTYNKYRGGQFYRFVWLDGCSTAAPGGNWPWAWGVPAATEPLSYYQSTTSNPSGERPSVFVGWDVETGGGPGWGTVNTWWQFRADWMSEWSGSEVEPLVYAFEDGNSDASWISSGQLSHLKEFGYNGMQFFDYTKNSDWSAASK